MPKRVWTKEEEEILKQHYLKPNGPKDLLKLLPQKRMSQILDKGKRMGFIRFIPYIKNEIFFEIPNLINTNLAAFLGSDGCICDKRKWGQPSIRLGISTKDLKHLEKIKELTNYNGKMYFVKHIDKKIYSSSNDKWYNCNTESCHLVFNKAQKWCDDLWNNWNIGPRKSHTLMPPTKLKTIELKLSYISGAIDGDGHISLISEPNHNFGSSLKIGIIGTTELLQWIKETFDYLTPYDNVRSIVKTRYKNICTYAISGIRAYLISKCILSLDIPRLNRKWNNARNFIQRIENEPLSDVMINKINNRVSWELLDFYKNHNIFIPSFIKNPPDPKINLISFQNLPNINVIENL